MRERYMGDLEPEFRSEGSDYKKVIIKRALIIIQLIVLLLVSMEVINTQGQAQEPRPSLAPLTKTPSEVPPLSLYFPLLFGDPRFFRSTPPASWLTPTITLAPTYIIPPTYTPTSTFTPTQTSTATATYTPTSTITPTPPQIP